MIGPARQQSVQDQRRQREVVDDMRLVPFAKIAQVFGLWHVCFGEQHDGLHRVVAQKPHEFDDGVGLRQVDRWRSDLFPKKRHCIEADDLHAVVDMGADGPQKLQQHLWVAEIEVDLIMAERAPDVARAVFRFDPLQQWRGARPHNHGMVKRWIGFEKELVVGRLALSVGVKPRALARDVVEHKIGHQLELIRDAVDVSPITKLRIDRIIVGDRKSVVRGEGKERQNMHTVDEPFEIPPQKVVQQIKRLVRAINQRIAIGDDKSIPL